MNQKPVLQRVISDGGEVKFHQEKPSRKLPPPIWEGSVPLPIEAGGTGESWRCGEYYGLLRRFDSGFPLGGGPYVLLSIGNIHETAAHDWRDFQSLKNLLVGEEWEALELYPAESRLVDPSNRFYLWCMPKGVVVWGFQHRRVLGITDNTAPQRPFPDGESA